MYAFPTFVLMENLNRLLDRLEQLHDGELRVTSKSGQWQFYILDGQLLYSSNRSLGVRRFRRAAKCHRPHWQWSVEPEWFAFNQSWEIPLLERAIVHNKLSPIQSKLILRMVLEECLFELMHDGSATSEWYPHHLDVTSAYRSAALSVSEVQRILKKAARLVKSWKESRLGHLKLSVSPIIAQGSMVGPLAVPHQYLKGDTDLWDILISQAPSLTKLTNLLLPMVEAGILRFQDMPDLPLPVGKKFVRRQAIDLSASFGQPPPVAKFQTYSTFSPVVERLIAKPTQSALIACIDNSPVLTLSLKKILTSAGYRTLSIPEPMRGLSKLIEHRPDLILLDLMLPNADGYSICKFLREAPEFSKTPIIILTGQSSDLVRMRARLAGASDFLTKPPNPSALVKMINRHLNQDGNCP